MSQKINAPLRDNFTGTERAFDLTGSWAIAYNSDLGRNVLTSNKISDNESTKQELTFTCDNSFTLNFSYKVSSEKNYDKFIFNMNDVMKITDSGDKTWTAYSEVYPAGTYTLQFVYSKDGSNSSLEDTAYVSDLWVVPENYTDNATIDTQRRVASLNPVVLDIDARRDLSSEVFIKDSRIDSRRILTNQEYTIEITGDTERNKTGL